MAEETGNERSLADELGKLGKQVGEAIQTAWESEDRKRLQAEIAEGLQRFGDQVGEALDKANESEAAKQIREKAEKVVGDVRESSVLDDVRKGLLTGLDAINHELGKLLERLEARQHNEAPVVEHEPQEPAASHVEE